ncbi:phospholipid:diacylglycerol acyltransferase [Rhizoctonia solani AG-3 Rhs1AP]|uniref:Phospholipid:diacylglycerol acyltransferase n=1 Tax=Rhizoctonia solani AG-3 Rhs1AP TaxID=1086054 RepID=X8J6A0_9AGAM|nr:phospholipid:diacylglycerol acyltransferase [Rhizoctonia solani AG-3 Rhs1AP]
MLKLPNIRRRGKKSPPPTPETESIISEVPTSPNGDDKVVVCVDTITKLQKHKYQSARARLDEWFIGKRRVLFPLGLALGILASFLLLSPLPPNLALLLEEYDLSSLSLPGLEFEWDQITRSISKSTPGGLWAESKDFKVGMALKEQGLEASHPVILIPGIVSTGLESWITSPEYRSYFRKRLWGTTTMVRAVLTDRERWISALMLDPDTGLDPPGIKVRAAQGLDAASTFMPGYWIWSKIIENLAVIDYDTNNLYMAAYDWRLSYYNLEVRDGYFSKLKAEIEMFKRRHGKRVVLVSHSMGGTVVMYFLKWVEAPSYGNGGPSWVEDHIEAFVNVAGTLLGVPKAMAAFVSGEMRDTVEINPAGAYVLERFFSRKERAKLFRSWAGSASMWIKGGDAVWGTPAPFASETEPTPTTNNTQPQTEGAPIYGAPDDPPGIAPEDSHARFFNFRASPPADHALSGPGVPGNLSAEQAGNWLLGNVEEKWQKMMAMNYSYGIERDPDQLAKNDDDHTKFSNPLEVRLPNAPSTRIFCLYGHGKDTERSYWYAASEFEYEGSDGSVLDEECKTELGETGTNASCVTQRTPLDLPLSRRNMIDVAVHNDTGVPKVKSGVKIGEGDGTVALLSLGAMCVEGWKSGSKWNPHGVKVITQEMAHKPEPFDPRGGQTTSDHIDILGSEALNLAVLRIAAGRGEDVEERFVSRIREYAKKIRWD